MAAPTTLQRPETAVDGAGSRYHKLTKQPAAMRQLLLRQGMRTLAKTTRAVIVDFDATDAHLHGQQEGRFFHGDTNRLAERSGAELRMKSLADQELQRLARNFEVEADRLQSRDFVHHLSEAEVLRRIGELLATALVRSGRLARSRNTS